jgi:stage V sporulation protein G
MNTNLDVRVYPIDDPKGSTLAFASIAIDDLAAIRGIRVVNSDEKGLFVSMPQSQDKTGIYHDIAFPLDGDLRKEINAAVINEFVEQASLPHGQRGYEKPEAEPNGRSAVDVKLDVKVFPIAEPRGDTLAFASVGMDDTVAIRGIRVVNSAKGNFVSMPQSKDKDGSYHDVAFPLSGDLRKEISRAVLAEFKHPAAEKKQGMGARLAEGKNEADRHNADAPQKAAAAKRPPGLGD